MDNLSGEYHAPDQVFDISEDFWSRDCINGQLMSHFSVETTYSWQMYINGFTAGRMGYNAVSDRLNKLFYEIWQVPQWQFRQPQNIDEMEIILKLCMDTVDKLFALSNYSAKFIGGDTQTYKIPQPSNIVLTP